MNKLEKSTPCSMSPIGGMMMSSTSEPTIFPNAAPIMTPTARSITLPRMANSLNSLNMELSLLRLDLVVHQQRAWRGLYPTRNANREGNAVKQLSRAKDKHRTDEAAECENHAGKGQQGTDPLE